MVSIAAIGDNFVLPQLFETATRDAIPDAPLSFRNATLPWPQVPFGDVGGVFEASGDEETVIDAVADSEIALTQLAPFTKRVFDECTNLRLVCVSRGGPVNVDLEAATAAGVSVSFAPGRNAQAAAEFSVGMMLAAMRRVADASAALHRGEWRGEYYSFENAGMELHGNTVGIVGFGAIGRIVAGIVRAFGANVLIFDPYLDASSSLPEGMTPVSLQDLMSRSRVVSLHARLTKESKHLIDRDALELLPDGAVLVNTARGGLLDYEPLPELLGSGKLSALALDVFDVEPPPKDWPLLGMSNVVIAPHLAGATKQTAERAATIVAQDVARFLAGEPLENLANPEVSTKLRPAS